MTYAYLARNRDEKGIAELDIALAGTQEEREVAVERANMAALEAFSGGKLPPAPLPRNQ